MFRHCEICNAQYLVDLSRDHGNICETCDQHLHAEEDSRQLSAERKLEIRGNVDRLRSENARDYAPGYGRYPRNTADN